MGVLNYCFLSVTSAATPTPTPISQDSANNLTPSSIPTQTKVMQKLVKLSTGVVPGDNAAPPSTPTTTKLRKYWGEDVDPLTSDDYIWNKEFMGRMKKYIQDPQQNSPSSPSAPVKEETSGFLSLNRVMSLDSLEIDLTKELTAPSEPVQEPEVENTQPRLSASQRWRPAPTRREQEQWDKAAKAATGGSDVMFRELRKPKGDPKILAAQSREQYLKLKNKLQLLTLGIGGVGVISAYISYSPEIAARGAVGQPRLLVPVALVMIFNRWNGILVPEYGFMHLELIPMLVGFFTYKIATFVQAIEEGVTIVRNKTQA
ncbi:protein CONSERVED ONLY IN THE GREEN LINEAGE 160, chloroplastic-like isoform X2 [Nicotiana tabacum]|uniref:Protein CONSERVED ONLY IN THE GREEN LINEAGE 160, chloroplastic-like isoform X2 n=1 Tax=Nicotiana tabacum TaxID=4097 RepID=A0AC58S339_TOBAC